MMPISQKYRFTFCVPNLNHAKYLPQCISSILAQASNQWRCVFVDGYSSDSSWEFMQQFASDPRFLLLRGRRLGLYEDWNECLRHVETEYFYFLPADDVCSPHLVDKAVEALDCHPDAEVCHSGYNYIDAEGNVIRTFENIVTNELELYEESMLFRHRRAGAAEILAHFVYATIYRTMNSLVFRRTIIEKMNGFASKYGAAGDYDWTMRLGLHTDVIFIPNVLASWRRHDAQISKKSLFYANRKKGLRIARKNILLLEKETKLMFSKKLNCFEAASWLYYDQEVFLKKEINSSKEWRARLLLKTLSGKLRAACLWNNFLCRLSGGKPFSNFQTGRSHGEAQSHFAKYLFEKYGADWPPVKC